MLPGQMKSLSGFLRGSSTMQLTLSPAADAVKATDSRVLSWPDVTASTRLLPLKNHIF